MQFEQFEAADMREALAEVKATLGPDAIILATRELPRRGFWRRRRVQITATRAEPSKEHHDERHDAERPMAEMRRPQLDASRPAAARAAQLARRYGSLVEEHHDEAPAAPIVDEVAPLKAELSALKRQLATLEAERVEQGGQRDEGDVGLLTEQLGREFERMRRMLAAVSLGGMGVGNAAADSDRALLAAADVDDAVAQGMLEELARVGTRGLSNEQAMARLRLSLAEAIPTLGDFFASKRRRRVALVGPTGVGKTTTVAKIAAHAALRHGRRVALISLDTYRIGAAEQIGHYARLVGVPVTTAHDRATFVAALEAYSSYDLVLIDTAGRGPNQAAAHCLQLRNLFGGHGVEVYVTLAAATRRLERQEMLAAMGELQSLGARAIILTKLDEAVALGSCISLTHQTGLPLAFVTSGQRVPEDLMLADPHALAERLIERVLAEREGALEGPLMPTPWAARHVSAQSLGPSGARMGVGP